MKQLQRDKGTYLYQQIYAELRGRIFRGDIPAGGILPSYRFISRKYQVNVATVEKAYDLLEANGYIERRQGSGSFALPLDSFQFYTDGMVLDSFENGQPDTAEGWDFATSTPLAGEEESRTLIGLVNELASRRGELLFRYPPTRGAPALIQAIHRRLTERGMQVEEENVHIVSGSQQGIDLICKSLVGKNTVVLVEDPSYSVAVNCFRRAGAHVETVPMEEDGPDMDAVRAVLDRGPVDFYYTMPNFHCPTNVTWSQKKRQTLLTLARDRGFTIIEDDCLGELYFGGTPTSPLRREDRHDSVLHLNSFSKCLVPGLRLGYMVVPGRYEKKLIMAKFNTDVACPALLQEVLALYLQRGLYDRRLEGLRREYAEKRRHMAAALGRASCLTLPYREQNGGVFFWVRLPEKIDAAELWNRLRRQNVKLLPGSAFSHSGALKNYIRLSYVGCPPENMEEGVRRIDHQVRQMLLEAGQ